MHSHAIRGAAMAAAMVVMAALPSACSQETSGACGSDEDCKGDRVCDEGECVDPGGGGSDEEETGQGDATGSSTGPGGGPCAEPAEVDCQAACQARATICQDEPECVGACMTADDVARCVEYDCGPTAESLPYVWGCFDGSATCAEYADCFEACDTAQ